MRGKGWDRVRDRRWTALLCAALIAGAVLVPCGRASAAPTLAERRAQATRVRAELAASRTELGSALDDLEGAVTALEASRIDEMTTAEDILHIEGEIGLRQEAFDARAIAMYKTGDLALLEAIVSSASLDDFFTRMDLLAYIQAADADLLVELVTARDQRAFLAQRLAQRGDELIALRQQAEARKGRVEAAVARQEALMSSLDAEIVRMVREQEAADAAAAAGQGGSDAPPVPFNPNAVISDAAFLDADSLSAAGVQAFLDKQTGSLKSYTGRDHNGASRTAAQMIAEAAVAWGVSPKVILVTLQKEQSLISNPSPSRTAMDWAMGCGKTDSHTYTQYQGFGNQIWGGAQKLRQNRDSWRSGISLTIDRAAVYPVNASTHSLYRYTPHFPGVTSFWRIYWRYWGDPLS